MTRDVEFAVTASDKSGMALASAEAKFKASQQRIRKESEKTGDSIGNSLKKGVTKSAPGILDSITGIFTKGGVAGGDLLAVGVVAASPVIGAALSAAVIGGAGFGGMIGGALLASKDPRVKAAGAQFGKTLMSELQADAAPFVDPLLKQIGKVEARFEQMRGRIQRIFRNSSGFLDPVVDGALDGIDGILRGFDALVAKAGPVMRAIGGSFDIIGDSLGDAMEIISGGSEDAASAVTALAKTIGAAIVVTAYLVRGLTELYGVVSYIPGKIHDASKALGRFVGIGDEADEASSESAKSAAALAAATSAVGDAAVYAVPPLATMTDKMNHFAEAGRSAFDATTSVGEAVDRARQALEKNGKTLSANTEKGRENRQALSGLAAALLGQYNATVKVNGEGARAQQVAAANRESFIKLATQFGLSKRAASDLATQMGLIPANKKTDFYANTHDAAARVTALKNQIGAIRSKTVTITTVLRTNKSGDEAMHGHRAAGGPVLGGRSYLVGESGPEILTVGSGNGNVTPNHALGGMGAGVLQLTLDLGAGIRQVVNINLREHDRSLKRRTVAAGGRA